MRIGCPREIKNREYRVGVTTASAASYIECGHEVFVERGAGRESGFDDAEYVAAGASVLDSAGDIWEKCDMIVKVKEPLPE